MKVNDKSGSILTKDQDPAIEQSKEAEAVASMRPTSSTEHERGWAGAKMTPSSDLDDVGKIAKAARETPEIRNELVEQIKIELAEGELEADMDLLAAQLLQEMGWPGGEVE